MRAFALILILFSGVTAKAQSCTEAQVTAMVNSYNAAMTVLGSKYDEYFDLHNTWVLITLGDESAIDGWVNGPMQVPSAQFDPHMQVINSAKSDIANADTEYDNAYEDELDAIGWKDAHDITPPGLPTVCLRLSQMTAAVSEVNAAIAHIDNAIGLLNPGPYDPVSMDSWISQTGFAWNNGGPGGGPGGL